MASHNKNDITCVLFTCVCVISKWISQHHCIATPSTTLDFPKLTYSTIFTGRHISESPGIYWHPWISCGQSHTLLWKRTWPHHTRPLPVAQLLLVWKSICSWCNLAGDLLHNTFYLYTKTHKILPWLCAFSHATFPTRNIILFFLLTEQTLLLLFLRPPSSDSAEKQPLILAIKANCSASYFPLYFAIPTSAACHFHCSVLKLQSPFFLPYRAPPGLRAYHIHFCVAFAYVSASFRADTPEMLFKCVTTYVPFFFCWVSDLGKLK